MGTATLDREWFFVFEVIKNVRNNPLPENPFRKTRKNRLERIYEIPGQK
jgi:hypothetical protein